MKKVECKDWCTVYKLEKDGFGDLLCGVKEKVKCLFLYGATQSDLQNAETNGTDAHAYLDIDNPFVRTIMTEDFQTASYYFMIERYNQEQWYKIDRCKIGRTVLTDNKDNDVHIFLSKCSPKKFLTKHR